MYKTDAFFDPQGTNSGNSEIQEIPGHFVQFREIRKFVPKKHVLQNALRSTLQDFRKSGHFRTFFCPNSKKLKNAKKQKNAKKKVSKTLKFWVFLSKIGLWRFVEH
jgi:hypothetical protein